MYSYLFERVYILSFYNHKFQCFFFLFFLFSNANLKGLVYIFIQIALIPLNKQKGNHLP